MKFIVFVIDAPNNPANPNEINDIDNFNDELRAKGHWITAAGISGPAKATLIDNRVSKGEISQRSLFENDEYYSGFWIIESESEESARKLALSASLACNRKVELRPFL
ncbi:MAG: hypothetical protein FGM63_05475 [Candidatus Nanopelagicaceae bacterium]|nr:hypothetical protein [Candidatus Nanopelagicaceae bacterium]